MVSHQAAVWADAPCRPAGCRWRAAAAATPGTMPARPRLPGRPAAPVAADVQLDDAKRIWLASQATTAGCKATMAAVIGISSCAQAS